MIRHIVAVIDVWRRVNRADPYHISAKFFYIIETRDNPPQVAYAVAVRILKASRIDLIDNGVFPPVIRHLAIPLFF